MTLLSELGDEMTDDAAVKAVPEALDTSTRVAGHGEARSRVPSRGRRREKVTPGEQRRSHSSRTPFHRV